MSGNISQMNSTTLDRELFHFARATYLASIFLTIPVPTRREKINLNFYFQTSLWCLKRFYKSLTGLHKTFWGTTKKCENKNLS